MSLKGREYYFSIVVKKATVHINKCFEMSLKKKRKKLRKEMSSLKFT